MVTEAGSDELQPLLDFVRRSRGFDFIGYKRASLERRFRRRMNDVGVSGFADYLDMLQVDAEELGRLFDAMLVNVTRFFRDPEAWDRLDEQVLPGLLVAKGDEAIRVWSAGCASGEEAYSIAMLLIRRLGEAAYRERVKVYGTDVDEAALAGARQGLYSAKALESVPEDLRERCFEARGSAFGFPQDLRRPLVFGRNDLLHDAPISRVDVLLCRNVLIYFNGESQSQILHRFHDSLTEDGCLFVGRSELVVGDGDLFRPVDMRARLFGRIPDAVPADRPRVAQPGAIQAARDAALAAGPVAQVVVDRSGTLILANAEARRVFGLGERDVGRPLGELKLSYRPVELRVAVDGATRERRSTGLGAVTWESPEAETRWLDVDVAPLLGQDGATLGATVTFADTTHAAQLGEEVERSRRELDDAYAELQATVGELQTTNEHLQSTNEELETMSEELGTTNDAFHTLRSLHDAILGSVAVGIVVVDPTATVSVWNRRAEDLWGLRSEEAVGRQFSALDVGLPVNRLRDPVREAIGGAPMNGPLVLDATDRRGRAIRCAVSCVPLVVGNDVCGAVMVMEDLSGAHA